MTATIERAKRRDNDLYSLYVQETEGVSEFWQWYSLDASADAAPKGFIRAVGAEAPPFKSGKRKDWPNWKHEIPGTTRTVFISITGYEDFRKRWEHENDTCAECFGSRQSPAGWGADGPKYRDCRRCKATGKPTR